MTVIKNFSLNGESYYVHDDIVLSNLIEYFNFDNTLLVLEYNNFICKKQNWNKILIQNQDKIEIVTIVGGG
jgi:sulfur carrier protein